MRQALCIVCLTLALMPYPAQELRAKVVASSSGHADMLRKAQDICAEAEERAGVADRKAERAESRATRAEADVKDAKAEAKRLAAELKVALKGDDSSSWQFAFCQQGDTQDDTAH